MDAGNAKRDKDDLPPKAQRVEKMRFTLSNPKQGHLCIKHIWDKAKEGLQAGQELEIELREKTRTLPENALLHALIAEIAKTQTWAGSKQDAETWKRLFVSAWARETGRSITFLPALDGAGVDIIPYRTSKLSVSECADLISYIQAWAAEKGLQLAE